MVLNFKSQTVMRYSMAFLLSMLAFFLVASSSVLHAESSYDATDGSVPVYVLKVSGKKKRKVVVDVGQVLTLRVSGIRKSSKSRWKISTHSKKIVKKCGLPVKVKGRNNRYTSELTVKAVKSGRAIVRVKVGRRRFKFTIFSRADKNKKKSNLERDSEDEDSDSFIEERKWRDEEILNSLKLKGDLIIPDGIEYIPDSFCSNNQSITSVTIPGSVIEIGCSAFFGCKSLQKITIMGSGLKYIRCGAFNSCQPGLKEFPNLPDSVEIIEDHAFTHMSNASFKDGVFRIPKNLRLIGNEETWSVKDKPGVNNGTVSTHVFYNIGGYAEQPLERFEGESVNYIAIDGVLYRKRSSTDPIPVYLISVPPAKSEFDQFDNTGVKEYGVYVMPNTVKGAAELSLNCANKALRRVVFADAFKLDQRCDKYQCTEYNISMFYDGKPYSNAVTIMGGYGNPNLVSYGVRPSNKNYTEYNDCLYSADMKVLLAVPPAISTVQIHPKTKKIDSGAFQQSMYGTPYNPNTGDDYEAWIKDTEAYCNYSPMKKLVAIYCDRSKLLKYLSIGVAGSISEKIVAHTISTVLPNDNKEFRVEDIGSDLIGL